MSVFELLFFLSRILFGRVKAVGARCGDKRGTDVEDEIEFIHTCLSPKSDQTIFLD